ncbi:hypothetical protein GOQ27_00390 [Clostridium sp. D2Q-11]|uniref:Uncharacterized protein n=1 Tax=Anaeromonas frigoriresistens TaxID=2683708 RepID=A0A942UYP3_9FIRM|nr:hypothetical protein [Anaeromonas frigoriresistens]MBS4536897.1 hypothetical protein [Anaeromonas frigoriresistens]
MDILDLIFPLLILLGPALLKSFSDKNKVEKQRNTQSIDNKNRDKEEVKKIEKSPVQARINEVKRTLDRKLNTQNPSDSERKLSAERNITKRVDEEELISRVTKERRSVDRNKVNEQKQRVVRNKDVIKDNEIGNNDIDLKFDKRELVKGIIMSEILSPPKALKNKTN